MRFARTSLRGAFVVALLGPSAADAAAPDAPTVAERRTTLRQRAEDGPQAIPDLVRALDDGSPLVRRLAARLLLEMGAPAREALAQALDNSDVLVRRTALKAVGALPKARALPYLAKALKDPHVLVRLAAASQLADLRPRTEAIKELLRLASKDDAEPIRALAAKALWPFHKESVSFRERPDWDRDVKIAQTIRLPKDGWRFKLDPSRDGHTKRWFAPGFEDSAWKPIAIEQAWQKAGYDYIGVAWYRRWVALPPEPKHVGVELHFRGVDECAWVWVNGQYVGQHDVGPQGWDQPFRLDVTQELKWGRKNQITVRAMNTAHAGGIWRPVEIEVLQ